MPKLFALLLLVCTTLLHAQAPVEPATYGGSPPASYVAQLLASNDPRMHAWAAHFALQDRRTDFLPELEKLVEATLAAKPEHESHRALVPLLDAIDQLGGELPAELIASLDTSMLAWKAHLLAGKPWADALPVWRELYQPHLPIQTGEADPQAKRLAAEQLARHAAPGFALQLLSTIQVHATITVLDPSSGFGGVVGGSSCCGSVLAPDRLVWPPAGSYSLFEPSRPTDPPPAGATLYLDGASPVYLVRSVGPNYWPGSACGTGLKALTDRSRSHLAGILLGGNPVSPFPEQTVAIVIQFSDREAYRTQVAEFVAAQQRNFDDVAQALTRAGLLTEEQRQSLALPIELHLADYRVLPRADLPPVYFAKPVVWTDSTFYPF